MFRKLLRLASIAITVLSLGSFGNAQAQSSLAQYLPLLPGSSYTPATSPYVTTPPDFPQIHVTTPANGVADGYLFLSNF